MKKAIGPIGCPKGHKGARGEPGKPARMDLHVVVRGKPERLRPCRWCKRPTRGRSPRYYKTGRLYWIAICLECFQTGKCRAKAIQAAIKDAEKKGAYEAAEHATSEVDLTEEGR